MITTGTVKRLPQFIISIHIPRVGDDLDDSDYKANKLIISIHIPHVGDDCPSDFGLASITSFQFASPVWGMTLTGVNQMAGNIFQSTSPVWGMTSSTLACGTVALYFNPHPPCGG